MRRRLRASAIASALTFFAQLRWVWLAPQLGYGRPRPLIGERYVKQATALACVHRVRLELEQLEDRRLLSGYDPAPVEQLFLEQLNDARANPAAYGAPIGLDLSGVAPAAPLAFNLELIQAARQHSQD